MDFRDRKLVFTDIETTGLNPEKHEMIEIGCIVADGRTFEIVKKYYSKIIPERIETAEPEALKINGYSPELWHDARPLSDVIDEVNSIAPRGIILGWNVAFDWSFLEHAFRNTRKVPLFDYHRVDLMSIAYSKLHGKPGVTSLKLRKVSEYFGINLGETHNAMEDIEATYDIFLKLMKGTI